MTYPPIEALVQHRRGMLLIERLLSYADGYAEVETTIREDSTFCAKGAVPIWVGMEYAAQGVAAYAGMYEKQSGRATKVGLLLGCRNYTPSIEEFPVGMTLRITVKEEFRDNNMGVYACAIYDQQDNCVATTTISAYVPENIGDIFKV